MDMDVYRRRLLSTKSSDALVETSISQVNAMFKDSPLYKIITLNGVSAGARVNLKDSKNGQLLLPPTSVTSKGDIAVIDSNSWMVIESKPDEVYPKANIKLCNQVAKWVDFYGTSHELPCIITKTASFDLDEDTDYVMKAEGKVTVFIQYNTDTGKIKEKQRFIFENRTYEVIGIDNISDTFNGSGILKFTVENVSVSKDDDTSTGVADNNNSTSGWGGSW